MSHETHSGPNIHFGVREFAMASIVNGLTLYTVLPQTVSKRVSIELGSTLGWDKYVGSKGLTIGVDQFGESAPADALLQSLGFKVDEIATRIKKYLSE